MNITAWDLSLDRIFPSWETARPKKDLYTIGVLPGEGIGPEIIEVSLRVLETIVRSSSLRFNIRLGGKIGNLAYQESGRVLTPEVIDFCESVFHENGAVICGPASGRFVYELRSRFGLFCKISPVRPLESLIGMGVVKATAKKAVDFLIVRENTGGVYFGQGEEKNGPDGRSASHVFTYREEEIDRILQVGIGLARSRRNQLTLILKSEGIPAISRLWLDVAERRVKNSGVKFEVLQVDNASFQLIHSPRNFDVVITSNLFGDILADTCGVLLGSRGMCFSGNFGKDGRAVYQTGHGAARDIEGRNQANPIGQVLSLAMMLQVSFRLSDVTQGILAAVEQTLQEGWRTADIAGPEHAVVGTRELGDRLIDSIEKALEEKNHEAG